MSITRSHEADFKWISSTFLLQRQAIGDGLTSIASIRIAELGYLAFPGIQYFKISPFILRRKSGMGFRGAFDLSNLNQWLIAHSQISKRFVYRPPIRIVQAKNLTV